MLDEHGFDTDNRALMLAALTVEVARERHNFSDAEMTFMVGVATQVYLLRALPDDDDRGKEARRIILEATSWLQNMIRQMDDASDRRTLQ